MLTIMPSSSNLQAIIGQLYLIEGINQETSAIPGVLAQSAPPKTARGRRQDSLFIHLSLTGQAEETAVLAQDLLDSISASYFQSSGSVTSALRRALVAANQQLLRLNLSGASDPHEGAITCAVLRHDEIFMVQTGEALAFLGHNFGIEQLPPTPPDRITPLGRSAGIDIRFFYNQLQAGDMLLLADPRLAHLPVNALSPALVDTDAELGIAALKNIIGDESTRLLLVEFTDHLPEELPAVDPTPATTAAAIGDTLPLQPRRERLQLPSIPRRERQPQPRPAKRPSSHSPQRPAINLGTGARKATSEAAMGLSRFTGWLADLLARLRPPRPTDEPLSNWTIPAIIAVIIPLLVALAVGTVYIQRGRGQRFAEIKVEIGQNLGLAEGAGEDEALAISHYSAVIALAKEAESLRPGDPEIARLRQQAQTHLDRLDNVTRLTARPFHTFDETVLLTAVTLQEGFNGGIYTLDGANSQVFRHPTDESYMTATANPDTILFSGQAVGSHIVQNIIDIYWRPRGSDVSRDGLAMLDSAGALVSFYPGFSKTEAVPLGLASEWGAPRAITPFAERLYILDIGARQIWRYFPEGDGFLQKEDQQTILFNENPELELATDIAIYSEDGSLIVVYGDGRIRYYDTRSGRVQWDEQHLLANGLTSPLKSPTAVKMVGKGLNASIFVADAGNGRIIEISRGGTILAQYRASGSNGQEIFNQITDFAVAKNPLRIFVTANNTLYLATQQ